MNLSNVKALGIFYKEVPVNALFKYCNTLPNIICISALEYTTDYCTAVSLGGRKGFRLIKLKKVAWKG